MSVLDSYTPRDWSLILSALLTRLGESEVTITLEELNACIGEKKILLVGTRPGALVLKFISRSEAKDFESMGAAVYGEIDPKTLN